MRDAGTGYTLNGGWYFGVFMFLGMGAVLFALPVSGELARRRGHVTASSVSVPSILAVTCVQLPRAVTKRNPLNEG